MFEGLIIQETEKEQPQKRHWWSAEPEPVTDDQYIAHIVRTWKPNEMPLKSVSHMVNQLQMGVELYTYLGWEFIDPIERWMQRKGVAINAYHYDDIRQLQEDFKYNRDVHTFFTPFEEDAAVLGMRATVVRPDGTFGV